MATFTRKAIMQTFLHILKNKPLDRITVKDICEQCEINRNTFYYYFKDIYDVLEAIFEDEVRLVMDEAKEGVTFHDAYARVAALILNNREGIMHIYASENGRVLRTYLDAVVTQVVRRFVLEKRGSSQPRTYQIVISNPCRPGRKKGLLLWINSNIKKDSTKS